MVYSAYGLTLTDGQKQSLTTAVRAGRSVNLRLSPSQLSGPDKLMLTATQIKKIGRAKAARRGVDLSLSKSQLSKLGGFGPFTGSMLAGIAAPMIGKMFGFGQRGKGLQLPGTGRGLQLPGTRRGRGNKEGSVSVGPARAFRIRPLSNFDIEHILKGVDHLRGIYSKDMLPKTIHNDEAVVINTQDYLDGGGTHWVCVVHQPDSDDVEYFDSFGVQPSDVVLDYMKTSGKGVVYSDSHIQDINSVTCGYYVCYFILERSKGRPMTDILLDFSNPKANEEMIRKFAERRVGGGVELKWKDRLAVELHKPVRRKFKKRRVVANEVDAIWSADLVDMQWSSRQNRSYKYLLNVIDVFSKYAWSIPIKDKTGKTISDTFQKLVKTSGRKPRKLWVDQGTEFYNRVFRGWLKDHGIEMYSVHNEGKAVVVERFNRTLKEWMWKYFSANNTHQYFDILDTLVTFKISLCIFTCYLCRYRKGL